MTINGIQVKEPALEGILETDEPVWSSNTGRNIKGKMTGDIVAIKTTVEVTWSLLKYQEMYQLRNAIINAPKFFDLVYPTAKSDGTLGTRTLRVYAGNIPRTLYSTNPKARFYKDITVTFIEQ